MKIAKKILIAFTIFTIITALSYIFLMKTFYSYLLAFSGNWAPTIYRHSLLPYHLLIIDSICIVLYCLIELVKTRKIKLSVLYFIPVIILVLTRIFTTPFEFVDVPNDLGTYRYDKMFVYNLFWDNEGDYEGGSGISNYIYLPKSKKIIYFTKEGIEEKKVTFLDDDRVKIGNEEHQIMSSLFSWS